jgi:hypothetical protein
MTNFKDTCTAFLSHNQDTDDWLTFKPYKQGIQCNVGFAYFTHLDKQYKCIYKLSLHTDYSIEHEALIYKDVQTLKSPFFCRMIAIKSVDINPLDKDNPFSPTLRPLKTNILFIEYLKTKPLHAVYTKLTGSDIYYILLHTLCILCVAHKNIEFNHNDIHGGNICVKKCSKNTSILYNINNHKFLVPTNGFYPVLIDYGMSHSSITNQSNIFSTLDFYHKGTCPMIPNILYDINYCIVSFTQYIMRREILAGERFSLNISNSDRFTIPNTSLDYSIPTIIKSILKKDTLTPFISNNFSSCLNIIKRLIISPVETGNYEDLDEIFKMFIFEWNKIEVQFISTVYLEWILKFIVDFINIYRSDYITSDEYYRKILQESLKGNLQKYISSIANFTSVITISFKNMIESLIMISTRLEYILYTIFNNCISNNSTDDVIERINDVYKAGNIDFDHHVYKSNDTVIVIDNNNVNLIHLTSSQSQNINTLNSIQQRGEFVG